METMDVKNLIPVHLESPQRLLVRCLICFQTPFFINHGFRRADSKFDYFCEAFNLTEVSIKTGLRTSPLCKDCLELIESIGDMLKSIRGIEVNLNAQKETVINLLRLDDFTQSPEELEGSNTHNFTTFQLRKDVQKKLKVFQDIPPIKKDEGRFAVSMSVDDLLMDSGNFRESADETVYESETFVDDCKDETYSVDEDDPLKLAESEEDEENSMVSTIKYTLPEGAVIRDCNVILKRVTTAEHERNAGQTRSRKQNLKNLRQEYTDRKSRTKKRSTISVQKQTTNRTRELSIINKKETKGTCTPRRNAKRPIPCNFVGSSTKKCPYTFKDEESMLAHVRRIHLLKDGVCELCETSFQSKQKLLTHKVVAHGEPFPFICQEAGCGKGYLTKSNLWQHMCDHTGNYPYPCDKCSRGFTSVSQLKQHSTIHLDKDAKNFVCEECGKTYKSETLVRLHKRRHLGRLYKCTLCAWSFKGASGLRTHMAIHSELRPYLCQECGASFKVKRHLDRHLRNHGAVVKRKFGFRKRKLKTPPPDSSLAVNNPEEIMQVDVDPGSTNCIPKVLENSTN